MSVVPHRFLRELARGSDAPGLHEVLRAASRAGAELPAAEHCVLRWTGPDPRGPLRWSLDGGPVQEELDDTPRDERRGWGSLPSLRRALERGAVVTDPATAPDAAGRVRRGSTLVVPLGAAEAEAPLGVLVLTSSTPGAFSAADETAATTVALGCVLATRAAARVDDERAARRRAEERERGAAREASRAALLQRITTLLQTSATTGDISAVVPRAVAEVLSCLSVALYVLEGDVLDGSGHPPLPRELEHLNRVPLDADVPVAEAVREARPVLVTADQTSRHSGLAGTDPGDIAASLAVPLAVRGGRPLGALVVNWAEGPGLDVDVDLFAGVAAQVAVAMDRAQLLDAERAAREELRASHAALATLAHDLQQGLLPTHLPERDGLRVAARYQPALAGADVGGDWYDVVATEHDVVLVVGDVQGHSTRAAGLMGRLSSALHAYLSEGHSPQAALERTNRLLVDLDTDLLATCCLVRLDLATGVLDVASAGHPAPVVVDVAGLRTLTVDPGPPLGTLPDVVFAETRHRLRGAGSVVLHTDGVVEDGARGSEGGERVLHDTLRAHHGADAPVLAAALAAAIPHDLVDDAAMLVAVYAGADRSVREARLTLPPDVRAVTSGRELLRRSLSGWDAGAVEDEAELVLSELLTNALVHTDGGAVLVLRWSPETGVLTVAVHDTSTRHPTERHAGEDALGGRGLGIVEALASDWGVDLDGEGKTVWASFEVPRGGDVPPALP